MHHPNMTFYPGRRVRVFDLCANNRFHCIWAIRQNIECSGCALRLKFTI